MNSTLRNAFAYYTIFFLHVSFIVAAFLSPLFLSWRWILAGLAGYYSQHRIFGGCMLTKFQFKGKQDSFYGYYLNRLGLSPNQRVLTFLSKYGFPWLIFFAALFRQGY
ncbi:MAG: hypothetical protein AABX70_06435 [Nanoarchaeota archaeon]